MARQHTENLFRQFKGRSITVKTVSGAIYHGEVKDVANEYVCLDQPGADRVFVFFDAIESVSPSSELPK